MQALEAFLDLILNNQSIIIYILSISTISAHISPHFKSNVGSKALRVVKVIVDLLAGNYLKASNDPKLNS